MGSCRDQCVAKAVHRAKRVAAPSRLLSLCALLLTSTITHARSETNPELPALPPLPAVSTCADEPSPFMRAIERAATASENPARTRGHLLTQFRFAPFCYPGGITDAQLDQIMRETQLLPPTQSQIQPRFETDINCWLGDLSIGPSGTSRRARLTYSFVPDGTTWGNSCSSINLTGPSDLSAKLISRFGTLDRGREMMRSCLATWRRYAGLTYSEVTDDGTIFDVSSTRVATRGDIRIGGFPFGALGSSPLAYNGFPSLGGISNCGGGDMVINTIYFLNPNVGSPPYYFGNAAGDALYFRNTVVHEHGHGLGFIHTVPCNLTKIMEPQIYDTRALLGRDDIRAAQRNYGDRYQGNQTTATAKDLGNLTSPILRSAIERDLSINGVSVIVGADFFTTNDYFKFTLSSTQSVTITVTPTGDNCPTGTCGGFGNDPPCCVGRQTSNCTGNVGIVQANQAGNLGLELLNSSNTQLGLANLAAAGANETIATTLGAGTYFIRVFDNGGQPSTNQTLQMYDLLVRINGTFAPPVAIAGIDRLATAGQVTQFIGNHNSYATEATATLPQGNFSWDLDADGTFETTAQTQPTITYVSNFVYPVRLRVVDSNGRSATDTINVTVRGATTSITSTSPTGGPRGFAVPIAISGTNFKGVTAASQVTVSGSGVTVSGTPVVNGMGTLITGLTFTIAPGAALGPRDVTITNSDALGANGTGTAVFTVLAPAANDECSAPINLGSALGSFPFDLRPATTSANQNCSTTLTTDVWFSWTASASGDLTVDSTGASIANTAMYSGLACPVGTPISCNDSMGAMVVPVVSGQSYLIRIGATAPDAPFAGSLTLALAVGSGACCAADGSCSITASASCTGSFLGGVCSPSPCPQPAQACCFTSGTCQALGTAACSSAGGVAQGASSVCSPNPCPQPTQACCFSNGTCQLLTTAACASASGSSQGPGTTCFPNLCPQPTGVCCRGTTCSITTSVACTAPANIGVAFSTGAACNAPGINTSPCCFADFDKSGQPSLDDLFTYLSAWFTSSPFADIGGDGTAAPNLDDVFIFLNVWFAGCP